MADWKENLVTDTRGIAAMIKRSRTIHKEADRGLLITIFVVSLIGLCLAGYGFYTHSEFLLSTGLMLCVVGVIWSVLKYRNSPPRRR